MPLKRKRRLALKARKKQKKDTVEEEETGKSSKGKLKDLIKKESIVSTTKKRSSYSKNHDADSDISGDELLEADSGLLSEYEKNRLENIRKNEEMLKELNLDKLKNQVRDMFVKKPYSTKGLQKPKQPKSPPPPRRMSLRIRRINPEGEHLGDPVVPLAPVEEHPRKPSGPLQMQPQNDVDLKGHKEWLTIVSAFSIEVNRTNIPLARKGISDMEGYTKNIKKLSIMSEEHVIKVVPERIFSMAMHPMEEKTLVFAGDKWGKLGVWDVNSKAGQDGVYLYEPHSRPINYLGLHPMDSTKLYSCSYDGTIRCGDLNKEMFIEVYASDEDAYVRYNAFSFNAYSLFVADSDGCFNILDVRTGKMEMTCNIHKKSTRGIDCHPNLRHLFVTGSVDGEIALWDVRKISGAKSKLSGARAAKAVSSVYFSPFTGNHVLSTSMDDCIRIHQIEEDRSFSCSPYATIRHNNQTGRWLTKFRAVWDPKTDNCFVTGSMARPRQVDVYTTDNKGMLLTSLSCEQLTSVNSLNVFHPTKNILAGGNSSGRIFLWTMK